MILDFINANISRKRNTLIIFLAESNSGGVAYNSKALPSELGLRKLNLWKNLTNDGFYKCNIGVNNLLGHEGFPPEAPTEWHGWELELSNEIDEGVFDENTTFLVKCGQGGSKISDWAIGSHYYTTATTRIDGAVAEIARLNSYPTDVYCLYTQGINDAIAGTNANTWETKTLEFIERIKNRYNVKHFYVTTIMLLNSNYISINNKILNLPNQLDYVTVIPTVNEGDYYDRNVYHWGYTEMKRWASVALGLIKSSQ